MTTGILAVLVYSCVEPFTIDSIDFDRAIVVEGRLTDESEGHYVKLSYTRPVDEDENPPLTGASVWVEDTDGIRIDFIESKPGYYECDSGIAGVAGKSYSLHFTTSEGGNYQSTFQELTASPPIDSIYDAYAERANQSATAMNKGIQFFVDTHDEINAARYFRYEWEETYEVQAPFPSLYEFYTDPDTAISRESMGQKIHTCYVTDKSATLILGTTTNLTENRLSEMPVRYITTETDHLRYAYSILVRQYAVSTEAYSFYREILANNEGTGSLFDKQLGTVTGNVTSVNDHDETVLGFFEVSGVSEQRTFLKFEDLDPRYPWPRSQYGCAADRLATVIDSIQPLPYKLEDSVRYFIDQGFNIHIAAYCDTLPPPDVFPPPPPPECAFYAKVQLAPKYCTDCRFRGPAIKPKFWIY